MSAQKHYLKTFTSCLMLATAVTAPRALEGAATDASIDLYRVPEPTVRELEQIPKNLARWHMGATLVLIKDEQFQRIQVPDVGYFEESVFLSDNSALTYAITRGQHDYIIDMGQFMTISRFFLNNQSAGGSFQLMSCDTLEPLESGKWVKVTDPVSFAKGVLPSITFPEVETRYLLVRFAIEDAGLIGNFGATGPLKITQAEFNVGKGEETDTVNKAQSPIIDYDFASSYTGTRIAYVSGGPIDQIYNLIDEDPTTNYQFPSTEECVLILDLRKETQFRTFSAQYTTSISGLVQVYMTDSLPSYFEKVMQPEVATTRDADGFIQRAELADANSSDWGYLLTAANKYEVVRVPQDFFKEIEDSYTARVSSGEDRSVQIFDDLERRYVIFRFVPEAMESEPEIQTALYRPGSKAFELQKAQAAPISFSGVQVIGDVEFEDLFFTMDDDQGKPGNPPANPPENPPVISE
ncbi:hypothetical protein [Coraliomargarita parva]|uniref:hypothetical protein n=1 Tax=Coraliomargarita parva TaxID=3014050 RepID=UPI0022B4BE9C|nr:hypothetical protein [Coraliomargarita parva]